MKRKYSIGLAIFIAILLVFSFQGKKEHRVRGPEANAAIKKDASQTEVTVATVQQGPIFKAYTAMGTIVSRDMARILPKIVGRISRIYVSEGDWVKAGQVLMQVSPGEYQWAHQNAAALARAARVGVEKGRRDYERAERLHEEGAISDQTFQDARSAYEAAKYQYDQALAGSSMTRKSLDECTIVAPISGLVTYRFGNEGELTGPQSPYPVFIIEQMGDVKLEVDLPEEAFGNLSIGNKSIVTVDAIPGQTFEGTISKIFPSVNPISKTFKVTIELANPEMKLRSGMTARSKVIQKARANAIYAPKAAFLPGEDGFFVYKVVGGTVRKIKVNVGIEGDDKIEVTSGLSLGDQVVTVGQTGLKDGMAVRATRVQAAPATPMRMPLADPPESREPVQALTPEGQAPSPSNG
ncbi:MAG TPA: efflux RND transporter periplasmic adaptor subunit [Deltaproteobacteria bacterium]|nr:efflux RND transporter periplasmic adaptor subunit [Deltaproteobacteria bacterium]